MTTAATRIGDVVIALGSNLGDRGRNLWWAIQQLNQHGVHVKRCSSLYETAAAYVTDQPSFLNAAVMCHMQGSPRDLLHTIKSIEAAAGRDFIKDQRWGPRPLDLDVIFWGHGHYQDDRLQVPHPRWQERPFVTQPVSDLWHDIPDTAIMQEASQQSHQSPDQFRPSRSLLQQVFQARRLAAGSGATTAGEAGSAGARAAGPAAPSAEAGPAGARAAATAEAGPAGAGDVLRHVMPLGPGGRLVSWGERTWVMGILNITPDSFSDGGAYATLQGTAVGGACRDAMRVEDAHGHVDMTAVVAAAVRMKADGADVLDVGGQSTRPGSALLNPQQELARVVPVIRALQACQELQGMLLSVDTFHAAVAREAVQSGVHLVNDVSGGTMDSNMHSTVAALGVPYVLMHMRGTPQTMQQAQHTEYGNIEVWSTVGSELQLQADAAVAAGIPAWSIIPDPGIGFAKTGSANIELLRSLPQLRQVALQGALRHAPLLVGPSRKGFLGTLTGRTVPAERDPGTVAACVTAVAGGADIVRVHNVRDVRDGMRVADAVFRDPLI